jgi:predicted amidophosphoribosyltransferase
MERSKANVVSPSDDRICDCPQCGEETKELHEGYCEQCCNENQAALDRHNHEYEYWQRLNDEERNDAIRRSYT